MLILQETTIIYYNTACCTPDDSRQYKTEKRLFFAGSLSPIKIRSTPGNMIQRRKRRLLYHSRESRDERFECYYPFTTFFFFISSSELKTNVRGRMAMARGRDHFSVGRREKKKYKERERERSRMEKKVQNVVFRDALRLRSHERIALNSMSTPERTFDVRRAVSFISF